MKKKIVISLVAICCIVCVGLCFVACNKKVDETPKDNISRLTNSYYAGESDCFAVSIEQGRREKTFIADGTAKEVGDFTELTIIPLKKNEYECISYVILGDGNTLSGEINKSDNGEYISIITLDFVPASITLTAVEDTQEIELCNVLDGALSALDIINIAKTEFKDRIDEAIQNNEPEREVYLKVITGDRITYYYYVSFIGEGVDYWAVLVDIKTGDIISKK